MSLAINSIRGKGFTADIIRTSRRKTASVRVHEGHVSIVVPCDITESRVAEIISKKSQWIKSKLRLYNQVIPVKPKEYVSGESFSYLGKNYRLKLETGSTAVKLHNGKLTVWMQEGSSNPETIKQALVEWYKNHAEKKLSEKVSRYALILDVNPASIQMKSFKARWGSCSNKGDIQFNWKIILAPNRIVDYVVVHELCHMKQHDHSPAFWNFVAKVLPDYQESKDWLKEFGQKLNI